MVSAEEFFKRGIAKEAQGDLPGAITDFDEAIKLKPDLAEAWNNRGMAKRIQGDLPGAITDFDEAIKLKPDLVEAWNNRGDAKRIQGDLPGANTNYDEVIKLKPGLAAVWNNRGNVKRIQGNLPGAITDFDEAIKLKPDLAEAWNNRGIAKQDQGDLPGAITDYDEVIKLKPDLAELWNNRGMAKQDQGDLPGAITDYDEVIKLKPDLAEAWNNRGIAKQDQGDLPGAITDYDEAIKLKPDYARAWSDRGIAKAKQGDQLSAITDYDEAIRLAPDLAGLWNNRGIAKRVQGDLPGAIADLDKAIKLKPDLVAVWNNRSIAKAHQGDLSGAIADLDKAIKLDPDLSEAWINRAVVRDAVRTEVDPKEIWGVFTKACSAIDELRKALENKEKDQSDSPMHYTNLYTLLNLAEGGKFRLYNAKSMDDSEEGNALFDLFDKKHQEKIRETFSVNAKRSEDLEVFIGSFVTANNIDYGDDLIWRTYGKHNGEERAGCALVFDKEQHFASRSLPLIKLLEAQLLATRSEDLAGKEQDEIVLKKECYLYPVCYGPKGIQGKVNKLCKALVQLCDKKHKEYKETCEMVAVLLDHVRYLFKYAIYQREKEYRLTIVRARKPPAVKEDPLRTYVECSMDMKKVTVLLGPEVKEAGTWKQWLEDKKTFKEIKITNIPRKA